MFDIILAIVVFFVIVFGFKWILGSKKGDIKLDLDSRFENPDKQAGAIKQELENQGKEVEYKQNGHFIIDGTPYIMQAQSELGGAGISHQSTVLTPIKDE